MGRVATPESIAAFATAGAMRRISRGSNGLGISEPGPKPCTSPLSNPCAPASTGGSRASCAIASTAAFFISSLTTEAQEEGEERKMNGQHRTCGCGCGKAERPVQIVAAGRVWRVLSVLISELGLAKALFERAPV